MACVLTREQIRRVDQLAMERYGIIGLVLMENAGRNASEIIRDTYGDPGQAAIICGPGNNGGDGCVIARHLHNAEWSVRLMITGEASQMTEDTRANFGIIEAMGLELCIATDRVAQLRFVRSIREDEVVIDGLLGTGFRGDVREPTAELISVINTINKRATVALDVPSGLDCDSGRPSNATIQADLTVTFAAKKTGLVATSAAPYVGRLEVADIGTPRELIDDVACGRA
ncbi:MAG: NAD(P)H-hydrate epimerase [Planctomycetes bacterium]|nr:NAD(P)H-hydrate epimerase [Planctomycetota bacterium]